MTLHNIRILPDPALRDVANPVDQVTDEILTLLDDMAETMYAAPGIGLAATQIGIKKRLITIDLAGDPNRPESHLIKLINPKIIENSEELATQQEGCLSLPEQYADVTRPAQVTVEYTDEEGAKQTINGEGLMAACLQHEIDHLDGKLFIDYISPLKRNLIKKSLRKLMRKRARSNN